MSKECPRCKSKNAKLFCIDENNPFIEACTGCVMQFHVMYEKFVDDFMANKTYEEIFIT